MKARPSILIVDDDREAAASLVRALSTTTLYVHFFSAPDRDKALGIFLESKPPVVVLDLHLDDRAGVEGGFSLLAKMLETSPPCRIIVLTGHGSDEYGIRALSLGAASFLEKPASIPHLAALIADGLKQYGLRKELESLRRREYETLGLQVAGVGPRTRELLEQLHYAAQTAHQPVLITGETGTGKGLCAVCIHRLGESASAPFIRYQPSFLTPDLVHSELFGHVKGAYTGAIGNRDGLISEADGGTLFLDEIDELPPDIQVTLLGVLQEKTYRKVGSSQEHKSDFRLIAASNQDPQECLNSGKLRKDLYHRIAHLRIHIPPLRDRREDILPLAHHALKQIYLREEVNVHEISEEAASRLCAYEWPGNVRELFAAVEGAAYHARYEGRLSIESRDLFFSQSTRPCGRQDFHSRVEAFKQQLVRDALSRNKGNQGRAAEDLGLDRKSLRRIAGREASTQASQPSSLPHAADCFGNLSQKTEE